MTFLRKNIVLFFLATSLLIGCQSDPEKSSFTIMAYYVPSDEYTVDDIPFEKLTHIIYSFTRVIDNKMQFRNERHDAALKKLVANKKEHPHIKVMIACGGWGGSGGFSDMANDPDRRREFVSSTMDFVNKYDLDGVDIDWEYPGLRGAGNVHRPEDKENFTALMKELREGLDKLDRPMTLTFASAGWERYYEHVETLEVMKYANYMNIMTYDFAGGNSPITNHHTNLGSYESVQPERNPRSAEAIVDYCLSLGVQPEQIVIGAAFYGRGWEGVPPENNGLFQPNKGVWKGWANFRGLQANQENKNGFVKYWDAKAKAPYLYNAKDSIFISYDDTTSVRLKTKYARSKQLGGIMFWQLTLDSTSDGLLDAIYDEVNMKY
ncbi:glycoside hydrolase family 18 protein [Aestuariivivens sediminicola]|uniref:glycoside hydrolase family 18 protein n=1 Tax=Aestuariivivens sediminicola TaxID=2913560 RepID=UPI001F580110|nr:glycoside hydrolase family 18 protein [Aestuariivivens sediminicola]